MVTPENRDSETNVSELKDDKTLSSDAPNSFEHYDDVVDASGLACPLPLLKMKQALNKAEIGHKILVIATDSGSKRDFQAFIKMTVHELELNEKDGKYFFEIKKKA